jgi:hypothetical protein
VAQGSLCFVEFMVNPLRNGRSEQNFLWRLVSSSERIDNRDYPYFHIELAYGDVKPRLIYQSSSGAKDKLAVSTKNKQTDYDNENTAVWKIFKVSQKSQS